MSRSTNALQKSIYTALNTDPTLIGLLGQDNIFDHRAAGRASPFVVFSTIETFDWSTSSENGEEHIFEIEVWSNQLGRALGQNISSQIVNVLHDQHLDLDEGQLINLTHENSFFRREGNVTWQMARLKFRAIVELL